jgi:23S rRNA pseudouridine2605 synthase
MIRLQKLLSQAGAASRRESEKLITEGQVRVNGQVITEMGTLVDPEHDRVELNGRRIKPETPLYRLLLKPRECLSVLTAPQDESGRKRPSLERYVKDRELGWKVVGPLDFHTEGVLLLTTDGALFEKLAKGKSGLPMTYHLKFQGLVDDAIIERLGKGWRFERRRVVPVRVEALATTGKNTWIEVEVPELSPKALRAAGEYVRHHVLKISRTAFGALSFEGLRMGQHRDLTSKEVTALRRDAGV